MSHPEAVVDLLALLAYAELQAFDQMANDARLAPDLHRRAMLSEMAAAEIVNFRRLESRLAALGAEPQAAMRPFVDVLADYHRKTEPKDWYEALIKAYVGDGFADDFYREVASFLDSPDRQLVLEVLHDSRYATFAGEEIGSAITADPKLANRMSMWARRLVGEGLSQAQRVAADNPALAMLILTGVGEQSDLQGLFKRLTAGHTARMATVGLNN
ncbi:ferritin-like domain-containing protein [Rugosimonospora acidiphila]|uniref:Ferritin-like domain-containing protein n=1 Tax=Rugosimonospora acidiphila TaxID=556531 RepID=A0ABP9SAY1_9ACTN